MHQRYCKCCGDWHDVEDWPPECRPPERDRADFPTPMLSCDAMEPVQSMATGKMYDSKSAIRAEYKALGLTEVGNDPAIHRPFKKPRPDRNQIKAAVHKAFSKAGLGA